MRMAIAEENAPFEKGNVAASPWITVTLAPLTRAPSFAAGAWSYSPSSDPCRIHGRSCRRVTYRQKGDPQNHVSNRFIDSSEDPMNARLYRKRGRLVK